MVTAAVSSRYELIKRNYENTHDRAGAVGRSFYYNFAVSTVLSGFNPLAGVVVGGSCAVATLVAQAVRPAFMGLLGLESKDQPGFWSRFGNLVVVLSIHSFAMGNWAVEALDWVNIGILGLASSFSQEGSLVADPDVCCTLNTLLASQIYNLVGKHLNFRCPLQF